MTTPSPVEKIRAKRIQAEQVAKELREAEIKAVFCETQVDDRDYLLKCRLLSKQRLRTQQARHRLGRKRYSIKVQEKKLEQARSLHEQLAEVLDHNEKYMARLEEEVRQRREEIYQTLVA